MMSQYNIVEILIEHSCVQVPSIVHSEWCVEDVIKRFNSEYEDYFVIKKEWRQDGGSFTLSDRCSQANRSTQQTPTSAYTETRWRQANVQRDDFRLQTTERRWDGVCRRFSCLWLGTASNAAICRFQAVRASSPVFRVTA